MKGAHNFRNSSQSSVFCLFFFPLFRFQFCKLMQIKRFSFLTGKSLLGLFKYFSKSLKKIACLRCILTRSVFQINFLTSYLSINRLSFVLVNYILGLSSDMTIIKLFFFQLSVLRYCCLYCLSPTCQHGFCWKGFFSGQLFHTHQTFQEASLSVTGQQILNAWL